MAADGVKAKHGGVKGFLKRRRIVVRLADETRRSVSWLGRSRGIRSYRDTHPVRKLQIGAGSNRLDGWLNTDLYPKSRKIMFLNAKKPFPFEDETFDYILSEHQIEHLTYREGLAMLRECYRVLKPGGKIRINTPDLQKFIGLFCPDKSDLQQTYIRWVVDKFLPDIGIYTAAFVINNVFREWTHQFIYDWITLQAALEMGGFTEITQHVPGESDDVHLKGVEYHGKAAGSEEMNRFETMVLEARRPG